MANSNLWKEEFILAYGARGMSPLWQGGGMVVGAGSVVSQIGGRK